MTTKNAIIFCENIFSELKDRKKYTMKKLKKKFFHFRKKIKIGNHDEKINKKFFHFKKKNLSR